MVCDDVDFPTTRIVKIQARGKRPDQKLFDLSMRSARDGLKTALVDLRLEKFNVIGYQFRHSGAAINAKESRRPLTDIMRRMGLATLQQCSR